MKPDLSVKLGPLRLDNPVLTASGTFGYGLEFEPFLDLGRLGGLVTKGLSPKPRPGNPPMPRPRALQRGDGSEHGTRVVFRSLPCGHSFSCPPESSDYGLVYGA